MAASTLLLGAVLTFGSSDGRTLTLTVSLEEPAAISVDWDGRTHTSSLAATRHTFRALPVPTSTPLEYRVTGPSGPLLERTVRPISPDGPLELAVYGDSRDGAGPHRILASAIAADAPDLVVHTGDVVHKAGDTAGWVQHLAAALPMSASTPLVYALGNHELWQSWRTPPEARIDAYAAVMEEVPPPDDPIAAELGVHPGVFHVRVGQAVFIALDSNRPITPAEPQGRFMERVLKTYAELPYKFIVLHHGPLSSGHHGPSDASAYLMEQAERHGVTAFLAGHDHTYERIVQNGVTVIVSGGGGAPLYRREGFVEGSRAFESTYNWVRIALDGGRGVVEAFSLEGALLDRGHFPPDPARTGAKKHAVASAIVAMAALVLGLLFVMFRLVLRKS